MKCSEYSKVSAFLSGELTADQGGVFLHHTSRCQECAQEIQAQRECWKALRVLPQIDPEPGYISRFWTRLSREIPWHERIWQGLQSFFASSHFAPAVVTLAVVLILAQVTISQIHIQQTERLLTSLSLDEIEFVQNIDLVESLDVLEDIDLLKDFDDIAVLLGQGA